MKVYRFDLTLIPEEPANLPSFLGEAIRAAFLKTLRNYDVEASNYLHKDNEIRSVTTDGFYGYPKQIKKTFNTYKKKINHIRVNASKGEGFNHKIERLHNSIRERTKIMRHFNTLESARAIMKGYEIFYNFCRKHQAIKCYPYELATDLKLGKNKWLELIKLSQ